MRSISKVGLLLLGLSAGQAMAACEIGDADGVTTDAGQGNFGCPNIVNTNGGLTEVALDVVYTSGSNKEVLSWTVIGPDPEQADKIIGIGGNGQRCLWDYTQGQTTGHRSEARRQ